MWTRAAAFGLALAAPAGAADAPLSAIEWLSRSVEAASEPPVTLPRSALPGEVSVRSLGAPPRAIGVLDPAEAGLSADLWARSSAADLVVLLRQMPIDLPLPLADALATLVSVRAAAEDPDETLLIARVDALLALGRIEAAADLIGDARSEAPEIFRRSFDIALLTGHEDALCRKIEGHPRMVPTYQVRVFCLARRGDWPTAALMLDTSEALGVLTAKDAAILGRFLHGDGEHELLPPPERPGMVTPLTFRLYEAIGEPLATRSLPLAFAHADLRPQNGWKARLEAGERLYRAGAIPRRTLLALYLERAPAASGGVWDRVAAVQAWQAADPAARPEAAGRAAAELAPAGLVRLLGTDAPRGTAAPPRPEAGPDPDLAAMLAEGRTGEAALGAILRASAAWDGDPDDLVRALAALEAAGLRRIMAQATPQWASR